MLTGAFGTAANEKVDYSKSTLAVAIKYKSGSRLLDLFMTGVEAKELT